MNTEYNKTFEQMITDHHQIIITGQKVNVVFMTEEYFDYVIDNQLGVYPRPLKSSKMLWNCHVIFADIKQPHFSYIENYDKIDNA